MSSEPETCLRCGTPYEQGQTVCFKCGAPIGETRSSTQPVPAIKVPQVDEASQPAPAAEPARAFTTSVTTAQQEAPSTKRRRRGGGWLVPLVCVLVLAAGGGAAYVVRTLTAPPPLASATVYHDPQHRFSFQRPTLWLVTPAADGVTLTDSDGASTAQVTVDAPAPGETAQTQAKALATQLDLTAAAPQQIGGESWEQAAGQVTGADGAVRQLVVYVTLHDGELYTIELSSPVASYSGTNNLVFQPLLASFSFS